MGTVTRYATRLVNQPPDTVAQTVGSALFVTLLIETIPLPLDVYIAPATSLLALALLPAVWYRAPPRLVRESPVWLALTAFAAYAVVWSVFMLGADLFAGAGLNRVRLFARQAIALGSGLAVFYVSRRVLPAFSTHDLAEWVVLGSIPSLVAAWCTLAYQWTGSDVLALYPRVVRAFAPTGYDGLSRTTGLMSEPSHFAVALVVLVLPAVVLGARDATTFRAQLAWDVAALATLGAFVGTLSTTGVLTFGVLVAVWTIVRGRWQLLVVAVGGSVALGWLAVTLLPHSYLAHQLTRLVTGNWGTSILTRYYSTMGPLLAALSSEQVAVGVGLGGTNFHLGAILSAAGASELAGVSWANAVNLKTFVGRIIAELGLPGLGLFGGVVWMAYRQTHWAFTAEPWRWPGELQVCATAVVATVFAHTIAMGSFAIPFVWFWLAVLDTRTRQAGAAR